MLGPVICASCGARVRQDRANCLRCGKPLVAANPERDRHRAMTKLLAIGGGLLFVGVGAFMFAGSSSAPAAAASVPPLVLPTLSSDDTPDVAEAPDAPPVPRTGTPQYEATEASRVALAAYAKGDIDGAIAHFTEAVKADPQNAEALNNLGQLLVRSGRAREAVPHLDQAIQVVPSNWSYQFNRARAYGELQEWATAVSGYREAARLFPEDYATQFNLAKALRASGDLPGAIASFERAIQLAPGQADFHLSHGLALEQAQRPRDAAAAYKRYLELEPGAADAEKIKARIAQLDAAPAASAAP